MSKMLSAEKIYDTDIITLFHASGDFRYRPRWREGIKSVEPLNHFLPRVGMQCRCETDQGPSTITSSYYSYQDDKIQFIEKDERKGTATFYILERVGVKKTKLTLDFYIRKNWPAEILFKLTEKTRLENNLRKSLQNLDALVKELKIPTAVDS